MSETGTHQAFMRHFLPAQVALRGYLLAVTRDPVEADDLLQEISLVLWKKFADYDASRSFVGWAMGMAKLQLLRRRRSLARSPRMFSEGAIGSLAAAAVEMANAEDRRRDHLSSCLGKLPAHHQAIVDLRFREDRAVADIASELGKNVAAVEMMLVRIRRWLHDCIARSLALESRVTP